MGHLVQTRECVQSKKPKSDNQSHSHLNQAKPTPKEPGTYSNELHVCIEHISKLYTDNTGQFPICSHNGNQYLTIAYPCDYNAILVAPFKSQKDLHQLLAYNDIIIRIKNYDQLLDIQILSN